MDTAKRIVTLCFGRMLELFCDPECRAQAPYCHGQSMLSMDTYAIPPVTGFLRAPLWRRPCMCGMELSCNGQDEFARKPA